MNTTKMSEDSTAAQPVKVFYTAKAHTTGGREGGVRSYLDRTGGLWVKGALVGKPGSLFISTGTGGGNESTIISV